MDEALWYVLHTYSGYENKVKESLEKLIESKKLDNSIVDARVPTETVVEQKENGEQKEIERKLFPGYVLVKMVLTNESWYLVRNIRGVTGFVGPGSRPVPLTEEEVAKMGVEKKVVSISYAEGDEVKVLTGPLEGFVGVVEAIDADKDLVKVTVSMFGRETPVELKLNEVAAIEK